MDGSSSGSISSMKRAAVGALVASFGFAAVRSGLKNDMSNAPTNASSPLSSQLDGDVPGRNLRVVSPMENENIPRILWYTYPGDIRAEQEPKAYYDNIMKTIHAYLDAWGVNVDDAQAPGGYLDYNRCRETIELAEASLVPHFEAEEDFKRRADLCRVATLYQHGGYFVDPELEVIKPYFPRGRYDFVGSIGCVGRCINTAFLASRPGHPLLRLALDELLRIYHNALDVVNVGPFSLYAGFTRMPEENREAIMLFDELELDVTLEEPKYYPDIDRQEGQGMCNLILHSPRKNIPYFYMHFLGSDTCRRGIIPHRLWFSYYNNILETKEPQNVYDNVQNTIKVYSEHWNDPNTRVRFLDDVECRAMIVKVEPKLADFFDKEPVGAYRGDICRVAALYLYGGYYIDVDMAVVNPVQPEDATTFISTLSCDGNCFFNAFFACTAKHPVLHRAIRRMMGVYEAGEDNSLLGPITMAQAFYDILPNQRGQVEILEELLLDEGENPEHYPEVERQEGHGNCNFVVHDPDKHLIYFFARFVGYGGCKSLDEPLDAPTNETLPALAAPGAEGEGGEVAVEGAPEVPAEGAPEAPAEPAPEAPAEPAPEAPAEPAPEAPAEPAPESPAEPAPETPAEPAPETPAEPAPETPAEPAPETPAEPAPETPAEPAPESPAEPAPEAPAEAPAEAV